MATEWQGNPKIREKEEQARKDLERSQQIPGGGRRDSIWLSQSRLSSSPGPSPGCVLIYTERHCRGTLQLLSLRTTALAGPARARALCTELESSSTCHRKEGRKV